MNKQHAEVCLFTKIEQRMEENRFEQNGVRNFNCFFVFVFRKDFTMFNMLQMDDTCIASSKSCSTTAFDNIQLHS